MRLFLFLSILFWAIAPPTMGELTDADLDEIRLIVKEEISKEIKPLKADIEALKVDVARLEGRISGLDESISDLDESMNGLEGRLNGIEKQISHATNVTYGLIALIVVAIGVPAWRGKRDRDQERKIEELRREIEALKQQRIVSP